MTEESKAEVLPEIPASHDVEALHAVADHGNEDKHYSPEIVTKIVQRERAKAYEKGKREALMDMQPTQAIGSMQQPPQAVPAAISQIPQQPQNIGGMPQVSPDQIRQMIAQEAPKALQEHVRSMQQQQLVNSFVSKMQAAETKYPGMEQKLNELDFSTIAPLIQHIDKMENTADIMHELIENPMKMGNLVSLFYSQPKLAEKAIHNLSSSIKMNDEAKQAEKTANDPFSQEKPSLNAGKDDGNMSVSDFQAMFKKHKSRAY
jgi:hypothetical protein